MKILYIIFIAIYLQAGIFDFIDIKKAKEAYEKEDYQSAITHYQKLAKEGRDDALFNLADSYYKAGKYKVALESFKKISDKNLEFKKLHNIGNTYAKLGEIDKAIDSYEKALKIKEDKDTRFNYELLKKQKEKKEQKKEQKDKEDKKKDSDKKSQNQKGDNKKDQKDKNQQKNQQKDQTQKEQKSSSDKERKKDQKDKKESKNQDQKSKDQKDERSKQQQKEKESREKEDKKRESEKKPSKQKSVPISDMQERKYKKMLEQRGVNTLMMELPTKGENKDEIKPW